MKRIKRLAVALLGLTLVSAPALTACGGGNNVDPDPQPQPEVTISSIEIATNPTKVNYESGDIFDPTGMVVNAIYSDGSKKAVTDYTYSKNPLSESDKEIKINYQGKIAVVKIEVKFVLKVMDIAIEVPPTKTTYVVGDKFDPTGMKVVGNYNDGSKKVITDYTYDKTEPLTLDDTIVTITHGKFQVTLPITVEEKHVSGIKVTKLPTKLAYIPGEDFDPTGIEVSTFTNDGTFEVVDSSKLTFEGDKGLTLETTEVLVMYNEVMSASIPVFVSESRLTGISVTRGPNIKEYVTGQKFDTVGMEVKATFEDGTETTIDNSRLLIDKDGALKLEDTTITISLGGFKAEIAITVKEAVTTVDINGIQKIRIEGEHINTTTVSMRPDFIAAGRTFIEVPNNEEAKANTSNGQNICGYNPGSIFEIPMKTDKKAVVSIVGRMSHSDPNYVLKDGFKFSVGKETLIPDDVQFKFTHGTDYWNWQEFAIGQVTLEPGEHTFKFEVINGHPNIDCFDFFVTEYGDQVAEKTIKDVKLISAPTKTSYQIGEKFDLSGLQLEVLYTDFTKSIITECEYDKKEALTITDEVVNLKFGEHTFPIKINVGKEYGFKILDIGSKKFEAETFNIEGTNAELSADKQSIDFALANTVLSTTLYSHDDAKVKLYANVKSEVDGGINELFTFKLNDQVLTSTSSIEKGKWNEVELGEVNLTKGGEYTFSVENHSGGLSLDSIEFFTTSFGSKVAPHNMNSIYVKQNPTKMSYQEGETFDPTGMIIFGKFSDKTEEEVKDFTVDKVAPLTKEDTTVTITAGNFTTTLTIKITAAMFEATEATTYRVEAEHCDLSGLQNDGSGQSLIENAGDKASNGQSLGHITRGSITIAFNVKEEMTLTAALKIAKYEALKASDFIDTITLDGQVVAFEDITLGRVDGNDWFNFKDVKVECGLVKPGLHVFTINLKGGPNIDCFDFTFTK